MWTTPSWIGFFPAFVSANDGRLFLGGLVNETECRETLQALCAESGVPLSADQAALCCRHVTLVGLWNRRMNLTRITGGEAVVKHVLDSLLPAQWLPEGGLALDVGSGAGFPGLPLAVLRPGLRVFLVESDRKKASFLKVAVADLGLKNVTVLHGRFEEAPWIPRSGHALGAPQGAWTAPGFHVITLRAVKMDAGMLHRLGVLLAPGGVIAYWAGPTSQALVPGSVVLGGGVFLERLEDAAYELPGMQGRRRLLCWRRPRS